jgi:diguanylate cyclase
VAHTTGMSLTIAILDIDHFKRINDTYGHLAGDRALQFFSRIASDSIRKSDRIGRYGGEEFLVVLVGASLAEAKGGLERVRNNLAASKWDAIADDLRVTITIGATQHVPGETADAVIMRADMALYLGKESGRDRVVIDHEIFADATSDMLKIGPSR